MRDSIRLLRRALPLVSVAVIAAVAYDGWIFYSRWSSARETGQARQAEEARRARQTLDLIDRKSTRLNSSHLVISYAVFWLKTKRILSSSTSTSQPRRWWLSRRLPAPR